MSPLDNIATQDEAEILYALVYTAETNPEHADKCVSALRAIGHERTALIVEANLLREQSHSVKA